MVIETTIALVLIFGALVMFHELGHFIAARLAGIRVDEFAFGFGPKLVRLFRRGDTEYTLHPIPLGGLVKLAGMEPGEEDVPDGFNAQPVWKRALVVFAGPVASFTLAIILFLLLGTLWGFPHDWKRTNRVAMVQPQTVAAKIGLRAGDRILSVDGVSVSSGDGNDLITHIHSRPGQRVRLVVQRNGDTRIITARTAWNIGYLGAEWSFMRGDGVVSRVYAPGAVEPALREDDRLARINGQPIKTGADMTEAMEANGRRMATLTVTRGHRTLSVRGTPRVRWVRLAGATWVFPHGVAYGVDRGAQMRIHYGDVLQSVNGTPIKSGEALVEAVRKAQPGAPLRLEIKREETAERIQLAAASDQRIESGLFQAEGLLGFLPEPVLVRASLAESVERELEAFWRLVVATVTALHPDRIGENVGGPVLIARATNLMVALGPYYVVEMAGVLSLSLAFINLFPIPALDGGHIAILAIEAVRRRRLTSQQMQTATMVGLVLIIMTAIAVFWSDVYKIIHGLVPQ